MYVVVFGDAGVGLATGTRTFTDMGYRGPPNDNHYPPDDTIPQHGCGTSGWVRHESRGGNTTVVAAPASPAPAAPAPAPAPAPAAVLTVRT